MIPAFKDTQNVLLLDYKVFAWNNREENQAK